MPSKSIYMNTNDYILCAKNGIMGGKHVFSMV